MTLLVETLIISVLMAALSALPLLSKTVRRYSKLFFLLGTGALAGLLAFDLLPDLFEMGGTSSLWWVGLVWIAYSFFHLSHLGHHASREHSGVPIFFLASMISHCLASGLLLVASEGLTSGIHRTVFFALLAHKTYEALTVSSVLMEREKSRRHSIFSITAYALALPAGVLAALSFRSALTPSVALIATSLAAGTLLGCLIFDFLLPSYFHLKERKQNLAWIILGLALTQIAMRAI
ncbi:MAG: hypothetical protein P4M08_13325 [Oligoflexia bacterium]|nr:hypothetical protein [Oligoflexia bacterium]